MLFKIVKELSKTGYRYKFEGDLVYFTFSDKINPDISVMIWVEVISNDMFSISFGMPNTNKLSREDLADYVFTHEIGYTTLGVTEDVGAVIICKDIPIKNIDCLIDVFCDSMLEVVPFIIDSNI